MPSARARGDGQKSFRAVTDMFSTGTTKRAGARWIESPGPLLPPSRLAVVAGALQPGQSGLQQQHGT